MIRVALIGAGGIARANHIPGLRTCPEAELVALCDTDAASLERARQESGVNALFTDYHELLSKSDVDAVIITTPNIAHYPITMAAVAAGKHVLCEKPLAMNYGQAHEMAEAADRAGVRHMTAFTYRFVPAMRYMKHLLESGAVGTPYHFRASRLQDFGPGFMSWRQSKEMAGSGELGDMLSHRIDFGHDLIGPIRRLVASTRRILEERRDAAGQAHRSDVEDWAAFLAEFESGVTGVLESAKLATGHGSGGRSQDRCEVNGSEGTVIYELCHPEQVMRGRRGGAGLEVVPVPEEFLKVPGSPRDPHEGDPLRTFRYDQDYEFIDAIVKGRPCRPSFHDGVRVQAVIDAVLLSVDESRWVEVASIEKPVR